MRGLSRVVVAMIAIVLPAGAVAAVAVDPQPEVDRRVGAAGVVQGALAEETTVPTTVVVTSTTGPPPIVTVPPVPSTTLPRGTTSTTRRPPATSVPPTVLPPLPLLGSPTTTAPPAPTDRWSRTANGITVTMRMVPAKPVAGQPVTFIVDEVTGPETCCIVHLSLGDRSDGPLVSSAEAPLCDKPGTSRSSLSLTHTYAQPGAYEILLVVLTVPCKPPVEGQPPITGTDIRACIAVGPGPADPPRCAPFNHFDPQSGLIPA